MLEGILWAIAIATTNSAAVLYLWRPWEGRREDKIAALIHENAGLRSRIEWLQERKRELETTPVEVQRMCNGEIVVYGPTTMKVFRP